jgi:hypothetical protein
VGVPLARVYAHFMGGSVRWHSDGGGTAVAMLLPAAGFEF